MVPILAMQDYSQSNGALGAFSAQATGGRFGDPSADRTIDELSRVFNTALIATKTAQGAFNAGELYQLMETPAFRGILQAVRQVAKAQGISERVAAEQVILTFRKIDRLWEAYVFQEGIDRIKSQTGPGASA